jgi:hypothetical protein
MLDTAVDSLCDHPRDGHRLKMAGNLNKTLPNRLEEFMPMCTYICM